MATAKMSVAELETFLHTEFPQAFSSGDITIETADGETCLLRQRYSERMLRPGGTVSGPTAQRSPLPTGHSRSTARWCRSCGRAAVSRLPKRPKKQRLNDSAAAT
jgi:hypothetical protein